MNVKEFNELWSSHPDAPAQNWQELFWLVNKVELINPKIIIEIGVARGGSLRYWEHLVGKDNMVIGIDANPETPKQMDEWWDWRHSDRYLHLLIGNSLSQSIINRVKGILKGRKADFLFIDGGHEPNVVFGDFITYGTFVRYGGIIAFHDIRPEMSLQYVFDKITGKTERFLNGWNGMGIGIYWKERCEHSIIYRRHDRIANPEEESWFFDLDEYQMKRIKEIWNSLKFDKWEE